MSGTCLECSETTVWDEHIVDDIISAPRPFSALKLALCITNSTSQTFSMCFYRNGRVSENMNSAPRHAAKMLFWEIQFQAYLAFYSRRIAFIYRPKQKCDAVKNGLVL